MALESVFKLSMIMNMVDNMTPTISNIKDETDKMKSAFQQYDVQMSNLAKSGAAISSVGGQMVKSSLDIVTSSFDAQLALGELSSLGIKDLNFLGDAATKFSNTWANTTRAEFLGAAYDIKSGIASLNDEGVAQFTSLAGLTAKATKATIAEMTSLFATGYGIYKDYYSQMSDLEFGEMFSSGISKSVQQFKTTGSGMAQAISSLGGSATTAKIPLEEQLTILGMLQATMSSQEAGTKYKAFIRSAVKGGQELGLSFMDANNQMLPMNVILEQLRGRFGETMDAAEKMELQKAFGDTESVALIDLLYSKTGDLATNIGAVSQAMLGGTNQTLTMANAINTVTPNKYDLVNQKIQNIKETVSTAMLPTIDKAINTVSGIVDSVNQWVQENEGLASSMMLGVISLGILLSIIGVGMVVIGGTGLLISKLAQGFIQLKNGIVGLPGTFKKMSESVQGMGVKAMNAFTSIKTHTLSAMTSVKTLGRQFLTFAKTSAISAITSVKNFTIGLVGMGKQAIITGATALPGLISSTWAWTAALLANPVVWVTVGIMALLAAILILAANWDSVSQWISSAWNSACAGVQSGVDWIIGGFQGMLDWFASLPSMFYESGKKIISTFVDGVKSMASAPFNAVKSIFGKVRELLPFSDAHEGPFSKLTLSGQRIITTLTKGIYDEENEPAKAVEKSFSKVSLVQEEKKTVNRQFFNRDSDEKSESTLSNKSEGATIKIGKMEIHVDIKDIEDIKKFRMLIEQFQEITDGSDPLPEGV